MLSYNDVQFTMNYQPFKFASYTIDYYYGWIRYDGRFDDVLDGE